MKGVAYQQDVAAAGATNTEKTKYKDPLADSKACKRDVPLLKELGTNVIRTYAIDPKGDHKDCMKLLQDAGIYVVSDLSEPSLSINRDSPAWNTKIFDRYKAVIDELGQYDNVIGFFAGNEVSNAKNNTEASAFVKAAVRDSKAYIKNNKNFTRWMGVGYAANDDKDIRSEIADYFNCNTQAESIDFWGYNIYSWCGDSDLQKSGYDKQAEFFKDYTVPVFFAEYGCNNNGAAKRKWQETGALYGKVMAPVFSGGIVYMYFQEDNDYGLVKVSGDKASKLDDFKPLADAVKKVDPQGVDMADYKPAGKMNECPKLSETWSASKALPPTPDNDLCDCMAKASSCVAGDNLQEKDYGDIFNFVCDKSPSSCAGIKANATSGVYGAYAMCEPKAQLAHVLDAYYKSQKKAKDACDFKGSAKTQTPAGSDDKCSKAMASASDINQKAATATAPVGGGTAQATGTEESAATRGRPAGALFTIGDFAVGVYMLAAVGIGAGMVAL